MRPKILLALAIAGLAAVPLSADFRIEVKGGVSYEAVKKPVLKGTMYVFTDRTGTLMSVKKADVVAIRDVAPPKVEKPKTDLGTQWIGGIPEAAAAGPEGAAPGAPAAGEDGANKGNLLLDKTLKGDFAKDVFKVGAGLAPPAAPGDYQVGRTIAPPASGIVTTGEAPIGGAASSTPMLEPPPPPPPPPQQ